MATVRAQRLLNNVVNGTTNSTALQTALGTASTRADWQQVIAERGKARVIASTTNGANAVGGSVLAAEDYMLSVVGPQEMLRNPTRFNSSSIGATVAASDSLMNTWTNNTTLLATSQQAILGRDIYTSSFAPTYSRRIVNASANGAASWDVWAPALSAAPAFSSINMTDFAMNDDGSILLYLGVGLAGSAACLRRSTNRGASFGAATVVNAGWSSSSVRAMDFGAGVFVIVGDGGNIWSSTDGITWTQRTSGTTNALTRVRFDNGVFIAAGGSNILRSSDGITWTSVGTSLPGGTCQCLSFVGNNSWVAGFSTGSNFLQSVDNGLSFSTRSIAGGYTSVISVAGNGTGFVLAGHNLGTVSYSLNYGASWTNIGSVTGLSANTSVVFYAGVFWIRSSGNANTVVSINPVPISASSAVDFVTTDGVYFTRNGYDMTAGQQPNADYEAMVVKRNRLFIRGSTGHMTHRGQ